MKLAGWLAVSVCLPIFSLAQSKTDSLKTLHKESLSYGNKAKASLYLSRIAYEFLLLRQYDSSLSYYYKYLNTQPTDSVTIAAAQNGIGINYNYKGFQDSSILYYNKALTFYKAAHDTTNSVIIETNLSIIYKDKGLFEKALEYAFSALSILEKQKPDRALASCYNTIGQVYEIMGDYPNTLEYYHKSLAIRQAINYQRGIGQSYNNIGGAFMTMGLYDSSLYNLLRSEKIKRDAGEKNSLGTTLNTIGEVYAKLDNLKKAESYFNESLAIKTAAGERQEESIILNNLANIQIKSSNFAQAESYLNQADKLIRSIGTLAGLKENLQLKIELYKLKHDYTKAILAAEELLVVKDSILSNEKAESLIAMQTRYESEKKEQQIDILQKNTLLQQAEINSKRLWINTLAISVLMLITIALLIFYNFRSSQKNKRKIETLLKELHHRVKNNLQILSSVLSLQSQYIKDENAIQAIKSSESRVNTMALIHKKLYGDETTRTVNMKEYVEELCLYLLHTYGYSQQNINLTIDSENILLDVDKAIPVGLILNELLSNALKYAYAEQQHKELAIKLTLVNEGQCKIEVSDNGKGLTASTGQTQSFGLKMVNTLVKELKGTLQLTTQKGTSYTLLIPTT